MVGVSVMPTLCHPPPVRATTVMLKVPDCRLEVEISKEIRDGERRRCLLDQSRRPGSPGVAW